MTDDNRKTPRRALLVEVRYEGGGIRAQSRISDMSATGIYVDVMNPLPAGVSLHMDFTLPDGHEIHAQGVVVRSESRIGMAVMFIRIKPEDQQRIAEIVAHGD
jgi:hypothetical protein